MGSPAWDDGRSERTMLAPRLGNGERRTSMAAQQKGTVVHEVVASRALRGNALGDPSDRDVYVYLPPGYDAEPARR